MTVRAALFGHCPECGASTLFAGPVQFAERCRACGADFSRANVGDGPAAFLTLIIGAVIIGLAMLVEVYVHPPFWLHALLWVPLTFAAVIYGLRAAKGWLFLTEWQRQAHEGRLVTDGHRDDSAG